MFKTLSFPILFILSFQGSNVIAQETSNRVAAQSDWAVFVGEGPKECWAVSAPKETSNKRGGVTVSVKRGQIQLFAIYRPSDNVKGQIAFTGGYPFAEGRNIKMKIDGVTYELPTDGEWAWPASASDDAKMVTAMKRGATAIVTGISGRGTKTKDTFSLSGFTAAVEDAAKRCGS